MFHVLRFKFHNERGVTLVELVVVLAVFMIVMNSIVSIFISIISQQKRVLEGQELLNETSYAIEYMARHSKGAVKDITGNCLKKEGVKYPGYIYMLTHYDPVADFYSGIKFLRKDDVCQEFFLDADGILKEKKDDGGAQKILSEKSNVKYSRFIINGNKSLDLAGENDFTQPRITIVLNIQTKSGGALQERVFQTTVSQEKLNVK